MRTKPILAALAIVVAIPGCGNTQVTQPPPAKATTATGQPAGRDVVATVDGEAITVADLEESTAGALAKLEEQAYQLKKDRLEEIIADRLLASEAKRRGVTVDALVAAEVTAKIAPVSEQDVAQFVEANRARIQGDPSRLTERIKSYLTDQRTAERRETFIAGLRTKAAVAVTLAAPPLRRFPVKTDGFPAKGPATARVTIVEFSDFHCPFCRSAQPTLSALLAKYPADVRLVYRHFPLDSLHPEARRAAEASWCAGQQHKFWEYHDRLYASGPDATPATLDRLAGEAGLDKGQFAQCVAGPEVKVAVEKDVAEGSRYGVDGTPGFFVNGRALSGNQPMQTFVSMIDEELKTAR